MERGEVNYRDAKVRFFVPRVEGKKVLDIGVVQHDREKYRSKNWLHRAIRSHAAACKGLDIDRKGVDFLIDAGYDVQYGDAQDFSLDERFDVVVAGDVIEHLTNIGGFLTCVRRHLAPGGIVLISTPNPFWWKTWLHVLLLGSAVVHSEHTGWFCERTLAQVLERYGLRLQSVSFDTVYDLSRFLQRVTRWINAVLPLPGRLRHNTMLLVASGEASGRSGRAEEPGGAMRRPRQAESGWDGSLWA